MAPALFRWASLAILASLAAASAFAQDVATYRNQRHGFSLSYPAGTFMPQPPAAGEDDGRVFLSRLKTGSTAPMSGWSRGRPT